MTPPLRSWSISNRRRSPERHHRPSQRESIRLSTPPIERRAYAPPARDIPTGGCVNSSRFRRKSVERAHRAIYEGAMTFTLSSPDFADGAPIPRRFTGDGENVSPALEWRDPPTGTKSFALIVEDPDAPSGTFRHWGIYDIPAGLQGIEEGGGDVFPAATTDAGRQSYCGPRPPQGHGPHHYHFRLGALDMTTSTSRRPRRSPRCGRRQNPIFSARQRSSGIYER